ncbi:MAG: PAS domain-containing sensor histidine kinase [Acidovorax sp.]|uniref:PAS domain-containing sensor histidine kinase n=1 Tax=Acidovorax sp. TaxID=1872122 RepID=UPI0026084ADA|nr:PAS domain-containing sensor histidine kinase [Acidovorax sp.]MDH4415732.1 PAS domain-containing sensor histidine kinase [Acidovorax sp.]
MASDCSAAYWEQNPDALLVLSPDGCVLSWNPAAEAIFGYLQAEVLGRSVLDLIVPPDRVQEEARMRAEALCASSVVHESVRRRKDGSLVHVNVSTKAVCDEEGRLLHYLSSTKDVTLLNVQRDAKLLDARFRGLLESTPDAIVMVNVTGRIVLVNSHAERLFGYPRAELLGQAVEVLLPHRYRVAHLSHRSGFLGLPRMRTMGAGLDLHGLHKDRGEFPVEISLSPLETEEGLFVFSAIRDVTERKRIEQVLRDKNLELENAALVKDRFLASMSHELRTPLNAIIGFTGTLLMKLPGPLNAEQEKQLRIVQTGAKHLLSLINDLLDVAKFGANKVTLNLESVDCKALIVEVSATLELEAQRKGLAFGVHVPPEAVALQTDRRALSQILINLLGNAIKFTEHGRVDVLLREQLLPDGGRSVQMRVQDTGPGIARQEQPRLFEAFSRVESANRRHQEGTGLGLYLSRKLAEALGGTLRFDSEEGRGSTFVLELQERCA